MYDIMTKEVSMKNETIWAVIGIIAVAIIFTLSARERDKQNVAAEIRRHQYEARMEEECYERTGRPCPVPTSEQLDRALQDFVEAATASRAEEAAR